VGPGGFGEERVTIWPKLLGVNTTSFASASEPDSEVHQDERQIKLDTERSFVLYPVETAENANLKNREALQGDLHELLVSIFRKRRKLSYFQGYHDIVTVLFLTLPKELQFVCAEKLSLHRLRDSMGSSLEPVLGQLRILQRLLHLADPKYASILDNNSPLPYFALSNLLTLFSHDVPTLPVIQHIFDYLLTRPPIASVYLAAAVLLSRKEEVFWLEQEGEDGMLHSLLSSLPDMYEEWDDQSEPQPGPKQQEADEESVPDETRSATAIDLDEAATETSEQEGTAEEDNVPSVEQIPTVETAVSDEEEFIVADRGECMDIDPEETLHEQSSEAETEFSREETLVASSPPPEDPKDTATAVMKEEEPHGKMEPVEETEVDGSASREDLDTAEDLSDKAAQLDTETQLCEEVLVSPPAEHSHLAESAPPSPVSSASTHRVRKARVSLTFLLAQADALYSLYPPTHPSLGVKTTLGPYSVVSTWSDVPAQLPDDDEAEAMVLRPELVVLPEPPPSPESDEEKEEKSRRKRRRLRKPLRSVRFAGVVVERRHMVAGAVLVLGVAMAVYGVRAVPDEAGRHQWRRVGRWVGGVLVGASGRVLDGLRF
ncbi:hypothetical protein OE88DRAFT_1663187, partial [Heliocybe sulcata]